MPASSHTIHKHQQSNPQKTPSATVAIDKICTVFAILMPATSLPQAIQIYQTQDVSGLSLTTWLLYAIAIIPFLLYGITHRQSQLIVLNTLWLIISAVIIAGILIYR